MASPKGRSVGIQSPIPLIYLRECDTATMGGWDSVTYPLDILAKRPVPELRKLGFSHLSP